MKNRKRIIEFYSFCDYDGYARRFARMAEKGWLIERFEPFFLVYRRIEPKKLTFYISYFPKASEFEPGPGSEQSEFIEFCEHTGWKLAARSAQMQVFYNESEDPVPIETDPVLQVETIHKAMKRSYLPLHFILLAVSVYNLFNRIRSLVWKPFSMLSSNSWLTGTMIFTMLLAVCLLELTSYFRWHHRAKAAAEERGELIASVSRKVMKAELALGAAAFLAYGVYVAHIFLEGDWYKRLIIVALLIGMALGILLVALVKQRMKRAGLPRGVTIAGIVAAATVFAIALVSSVVAVGVRYYDADKPSVNLDDPPDPPLALSDLMDTGTGWVESRQSSGGTFIMSRYGVSEYLRTGGERWEDPSLQYEIYQVRLPFLTPLVRYAAQQYVDGNHKVMGITTSLYISMNPEPWHADKAFRRAYDRGLLDDWMFFYGNRIVFLHIDGEPTREQKDLVAAALGGHSFPPEY